MTHPHTTAHSTPGAGSHAAETELTVLEDGRVLNDPTHARPIGHGNSTGGWLMAALVVVGFAAGCVGLLADLPFLVWAGVAMIVAGAVVGIVAPKPADDAH
ncbi:HGxxPAAW family protein [Micrococcus sp.]|uniref:HGxxPAAW family protein n=1 Tax=Micrococcus sp. TaxID=1271 RepID=UPI002A911547|nr:HGxxPAAW family protein [Micrococcus sp.]MDY6054419.1 HGxxPAAW family protein [Micrococcus sp.]